MATGQRDADFREKVQIMAAKAQKIGGPSDILYFTDIGKQYAKLGIFEVRSLGTLKYR
jgi:hypothetical protein